MPQDELVKDETPTTLTGGALDWLRAVTEDLAELSALVIVWSLEEPHRVGELGLLPDGGGPQVIGRGKGGGADARGRMMFCRQRPAHLDPTGPLTSRRISRDQLEVTPTGEGLEVKRIGRCPLLHNGTEVDRALVRVGDVIELRHQLVFFYERRRGVLPPLRSHPAGRLHAFGDADAHGLVGESEAAWALRDELAFVAAREGHTLVLGPSGTGKELAARSIHGLSKRSGQRLISRNAATFPEGLIDAELFGNVRDYPNPGMRERRGLIGEADGATLFLDEIGELPATLQSHLLRVLDAGGEYQRLGEPRSRTADLRLVAATNRDPDALKHDLLARFKLRVGVPGLEARRSDIPLVIRHVLRAIASGDPKIGERFFDGWDGHVGQPRVAPDLVSALIRHTYTHHVRELEALLWRAMAGSHRNFIALTDDVRAQLAVEAPAEAHRDPTELTELEIRAALERHDGNQSRAYRELGLSSRHALYRLIKRYGIEVPKAE